MKRFSAPIIATLLIAAVALPSGPAGADETHGWRNPFCSADVAVLPWDRTENQPSSVRHTDRYFVQLSADGKTDAAATITLITSNDAYSVVLPRAPLQAAPDGDGGAAAPVAVTFDKVVDVRYAYVDSVGVDGAAPAACPTVPHAVQRFGLDAAHPDAMPSLQGAQTVAATYNQAIPVLPCGKAYTGPNTRGSPPGSFLGSGYGRRPLTVAIRIYIDSNGIPSNASIERSSGVEGYDVVALGAAEHMRYTPAQFLCTPVVSTMIYELRYEP